jgi:hypothetical protein
MVGKMVRRGAVVAVAAPLVAAGARRISQAMEARRGPTRTSGMRRSAEMMQRPFKRTMGGGRRTR